MKNSKYKILILSDLNESTNKTIKSSISLSKIVNADVSFFYVKKPTDIVEKDSQLSAMRTINKEYILVDKNIKALIDPVSEDYNVAIKHAFTFGNIKSEITKHIDENKPDIIVLGKRKSKVINFIGDNITEFILKKHKGIIMIAGDNNSLEPNKELSLGVFNNAKSNSFIDSIISSTEKPLKSFNIIENSGTFNKENISQDKNTIEYVFEKGDNAIKSISNYLSKSNTNLLFVNRENSSTKIQANIKEVINTLNCSLILTT